MKKSERGNRWGRRSLSGCVRYPKFTVDLVDLRYYEGPGNVSSTDYRLVISDGDASVEIETTNRSGTSTFEFRGQEFALQIYDGDDGLSCDVGPTSGIPEPGPGISWLPFELDGVRIDQNTDFPALVARTLGGSAPEARWARSLWSSLAETGLQDEVGRAAGACLRSTDPLVRASALRFFDSVGQVPGSEVIEEVAAASDVDPLDAVPDPTYASGVTLGMSVRIGLSSRIVSLREAGVDPGRALAIAKNLILLPGRAKELLYAVSRADWPWFERHVEKIVEATPELPEVRKLRKRRGGEIPRPAPGARTESGGGDDGISYPWLGVRELGTPLPWLPVELDGVRIDQNTDLPALVARTLGGWTPAAARPFDWEGPASWALKLRYSLAGTGLEDEVGRAAGACLRSTDPLTRASALRFFDSVGQVPGSEVIEEMAAASDVDPLDAVPDPTYASGVTLGTSLWIALSSRIRSLREAGVDPDRALAIAKRLIGSRNRRGEARRRRRAREALNAEIVKANPKVSE